MIHAAYVKTISSQHLSCPKVNFEVEIETGAALGGKEAPSQPQPVWDGVCKCDMAQTPESPPTLWQQEVGSLMVVACLNVELEGCE
eukprot:c11810_g2_i1 orf=217-474(+)